MTTRAKTGSLKPKTFPEFHLYRTIRHPFTSYHTILQETKPSCFKKAAGDPRWQQAMTVEFEALISNGTWTLCPPLPHQHIISNKWVYRIKQKPDGSIERFKARLVAKGYEQQCGIDYTETFSPMIKSSAIRVLLSLTVQFDWSIRQLDVSNAFLHGTLTKTIYMQQPKGFVDQSHPHFVCKLHKAIYGLKQAPRAWFNRLSSFLLELGFVASLVDSSLFILNSGLHNIFMLIYVDDIIITGSNSDVIQALISKLQQEFPLKDLGPLHFFLGVQASRTATGLHLCQAIYIHTLLHHSKMLEAKPAKSPSPSGLKLSKFDGDLLPDPTAYQQIVGALQYCTLTRPDISFSVNQLCQHMHAPTSAHWSAAKRVLRYLKSSVDHGLHYTRGPLHLTAYCDSDWAGDPDDRRSTTGFAICLGRNLVSWSAKKQPIVSRSSTEAEYRALAITTAEMFWLRITQGYLCYLNHCPYNLV